MPKTITDLIAEQEVAGLRRLVAQLRAENLALRNGANVPARCAQCGKETLRLEMLTTADGLHICEHCAYWD